MPTQPTQQLTESRMDLILWRHAEAVDGTPDLARELTQRGRKQAKQMAAWLNARLPADAQILASPAIRTQQTAEALGRPFETERALSPTSDTSDLLAACGWPQHSGTVVIIGHQPTLGRIAALLMSGEEAYWSMKKGGVWWFSNRVRQGETQTVLRAVMNPDLVE